MKKVIVWMLCLLLVSAPAVPAASAANYLGNQYLEDGGDSVATAIIINLAEFMGRWAASEIGIPLDKEDALLAAAMAPYRNVPGLNQVLKVYDKAVLAYKSFEDLGQALNQLSSAKKGLVEASLASEQTYVAGVADLLASIQKRGLADGLSGEELTGDLFQNMDRAMDGSKTARQIRQNSKQMIFIFDKKSRELLLSSADRIEELSQELMKTGSKQIYHLARQDAIDNLQKQNQQQNQQKAVQEGEYYIKNVHTGKYLNVYANANKNGTNIDIYEKDYTVGQKFNVYAYGNSYAMTPASSSDRKVVNIYGDTARSGSNVVLWDRTNHTTQLWEFEASANGVYIIRSAYNRELALTSQGTKNSSNVNVATYTGAANQQWVLEPTTAEKPVAEPNEQKKLLWPVLASSKVTQQYSSNHRALDIGNPGYSAEIVAVADGVVTTSLSSCVVGNENCGQTYGNYVVIKHEVNGEVFYTYYAHLKQNEVYVKVNDRVKAGTKIGLMGNTGKSTGMHLHFEIRFGSTAFGNQRNPLDYLAVP